MHVRGRLQAVGDPGGGSAGGLVPRAAGQRAAGQPGEQLRAGERDPVRYPGQRHAGGGYRVRLLVQLDDGRDGHDREVRGAPHHLVEGPALPRPADRDQHVGDDLGLRQRGGPIADEQLAGGHGAVAVRATDHDVRASGQCTAADLRCRIRVRQAAADRAAVAHAHVADVPDRRGEQRAVPAHQIVPKQNAVPGEGGQPEHAVGDGRLPLVGHVDVDEQLRMGEPEVEHRHQALAAGQDLRLVTAVGQQAHGLVVAASSYVLEDRGNHPRSWSAR